MYALNLDNENRILSATYPKYAPKDAVIAEALPEGNINDYLYIDGGYVYDPLPVEETEPVSTVNERITELEEAMELLLSGVTE